MIQIIYPAMQDWPALAQRPLMSPANLDTLAKEVFEAVRRDGDQAVYTYIRRFEGNSRTNFCIDPSSMAAAKDLLPAALRDAIALAAANISRFHRSQAEQGQRIETMPGVSCWRESRAIERVGIYIPGGTAPLFSTVLMLAIPAALAGCREIILCTPADAAGNINPAILFAAELTGIRKVFAVGGMQAIAAMATGTASIPKADKIFGPGNQYVTAAKTYAQSMGVAIDLPAGPSEVLVIADHTADPAFVAADLLSQAEHGPDSQVMLLSDDGPMLKAILTALESQLQLLPRKDIAAMALNNSKCILMPSMEDCFRFSNLYAPEHLIIATGNPEEQIPLISNAGSVFLGHYSCESAGDYASGTNHTLPTNGFAKAYSGVSLDSFVKKITFQQISREGISAIGPAIELMAEAEGLRAHAAAVSVRLNSISGTDN